jgi:hypothetical protein
MWLALKAFIFVDFFEKNFKSSLIFYKDVSALFTLGELQPYAYHTRLKFA